MRMTVRKCERAERGRCQPRVFAVLMSLAVVGCASDARPVGKTPERAQGWRGPADAIGESPHSGGEVDLALESGLKTICPRSMVTHDGFYCERPTYVTLAPTSGGYRSSPRPGTSNDFGKNDAVFRKTRVASAMLRSDDESRISGRFDELSRLYAWPDLLHGFCLRAEFTQASPSQQLCWPVCPPDSLLAKGMRGCGAPQEVASVWESLAARSGVLLERAPPPPPK